MTLDLSSLELACQSFHDVLQEVLKDADLEAMRPSLRKAVESGVIQHFEFCYELAWKMMKRCLGENMGKNEVEGITRRHLFRLALEYRLIEDLETWMVFHQARNLTSHSYGEVAAREILNVAKTFLPHLLFLLKRLQELNHDDVK